MSRFCPNCGTEVDETAVFCPTCGQPIDEETETEMPAAPAWPAPPQPAAAPEPRDEPAAPAPSQRWDDSPRFDGAATSDAPPPHEPIPAEPPTRVEARPPDAESPPRPAGDSSSAMPEVNLPVTMPVTLSAWLIGGGAVLAALGLLIGLFDGAPNAVEILLLVVLLGVAATVFLSASIPEIPNLRLITLAVVLVAFGIALDRLGLGGAGVGELLLFLGAAAAAIGAILLELGRDQPLGGPGG